MDKEKRIKPWRKRVLDGIIAILCNYAALAAGVAVYQGKSGGYLSCGVSVLCLFFIASLYED